MNRRSLIAVLLTLTISGSAYGQQPTASPTPASSTQQPAAGDDEVVRITANLVQVDAVVTDPQGHQVIDLTDQDFEVLEDGHSQKITNFSYVTTGTGRVAAGVTPVQPKLKPGQVLSGPPIQIQPEQVHRTIALVVDDLGLSFESTVYVRQALKKFVDQQLQAGDLAAIIRTSAGTGALQQFTSDKRQLYAAIERVRWYPSGRGKIGSFDPIDLDPLARLSGRAAETIPGTAPTFGAGGDEGVEQFRQDVFSVGTLGALRFVVQGMGKLPGRKSVVLVSDGISIFNRVSKETSSGQNGSSANARSSRDPQANGVLDLLQRITDFANRASVVIYTMDARGLQTLGFSAADNTDDQSSQQIESRLSDRHAEFYNSQDGLNYLARQTGGFFIHDSNDLAGGIEKVLDDQRGYYLIGYRPDETTFDATGHRSFHHLEVKLKRPGLKVRARTGFFGITDEEIRRAPRTDEQNLLEALLSPFSSPDIHLRLTSLFGSESQNASVMRALLHIDGHDLAFSDAADGWHQLSFEVVAVTLGEDGVVADKYRRDETMRVRDDAYRQAVEHGLIYNLQIPIAKAGAYQLHVAVRDANSKRIGSASEFIEVPDLKKGHLALSGLVIGGVTPGADSKADFDPEASPAVRRLRAGMQLNYAYLVYNAKLDKQTHEPQLQTQIRLFRGDKLIYTGQVLAFAAAQRAATKMMAGVGNVQLGSTEEAGDYFLQLTVTDLLADKKHNVTESWIDFELVK